MPLRKTLMMAGVVGACLLPAPALAAEGRLLSEIRYAFGRTMALSWQGKEDRDGQEVYRNVEAAFPGVRLQLSELRIDAVGRGYAMDLSDLRVFFDALPRTTLALEQVKVSVTDAESLFRNASNLSVSLCHLAGLDVGIQGDMLRMRADPPLPTRNRRPVTASVEGVEINMRISGSPDACGVSLGLSLQDMTGTGSNREEMALGQARIDLSMPGSIAAMLVPEHRMIDASASLQDGDVRISGGSPLLRFPEVTGNMQLGAVSVAPLVVEILRQVREYGSIPEHDAIWSALRPIQGNVNLSFERLSLISASAFPTELGVRFRNAGLSNLIITGSLGAEMRQGDLQAEVDMHVTGISRTHLSGAFRLSDMDDRLAIPATGLALHHLLLRQEDEGFLEAFERIAGIPLPVLLTLYRSRGIPGAILEDIPDAVRNRLLDDAIRFFHVSETAPPARMRIRSLAPLSLFETFFVLRRNPGLMDELLEITHEAP